MWEDNVKKNQIKKVILFILILLIAGAILYLMWQNHLKTEQEDELLLQAHEQQQQQQNASRQESIDDIEAEYQKDLQCLATYLPGIVCWGDSMVSGSSGSISFPYVLEKYIQANITDLYDFKSSIPNAADYSYLDWDSYKVEIPVINMGGGNETTYTVAGRAGTDPFVLSRNLEIPGDTTPVRISFESESGHDVNPLTNGDVGVNPVVIENVEGTLSIDHSEDWYSSATYTFTRSVSGNPLTVEQNSKITTSGTDMYRDYIHVICVGTYGSFVSTDDLIAQIRSILSRQCANTDRYIVLGFCCQNSIWNNFESVDSALKSAFGTHFINVRSYLCSDGITDSKLSVSSTDKEYASYGIVPRCFRDSSGDSQLNSVAQKLVGKLVYDRMESLGYFKEVRSELYIDEVVKQLLKDDPEYLDNVLQKRLKEIGISEG